MNPLPELDAEEETEVVNYVVMRCKGFSFRIKSEAFEKLVTKNKKENDEEHHDRILRTVQGRVKIISKEFPAVHGDYDVATERIYERVLDQVS